MTQFAAVLAETAQVDTAIARHHGIWAASMRSCGTDSPFAL
jgi:hypothetical protein